MCHIVGNEFTAVSPLRFAVETVLTGLGASRRSRTGGVTGICAHDSRAHHSVRGTVAARANIPAYQGHLSRMRRGHGGPSAIHNSPVVTSASYICSILPVWFLPQRNKDLLLVFTRAQQGFLLLVTVHIKSIAVCIYTSLSLSMHCHSPSTL